MVEMDVSNQQIAEKIKFFGQLLEILGEEPFKIRAYERASETIRRLNKPAAGMNVDELVAIPTIGINIAQKIVEYVNTGKIQELEELVAKIPPDLVELLNLEGVGPKTVHKLWKKLGIENIEQLERAARGRRIRAISGFGAKKEQQILQSIQNYRIRSERMTRREADQVIAQVASIFAEDTCTVAGSYRRGRSTIGDIDIVTSETPKKINPLLRSRADEVIDEGERKTSIRVLGKRVDIRFIRPEQFGSMLLYLTGSKDFNIRLRGIAIMHGWKLNEYGIEERRSGRMHIFPDEASMFAHLRMAYIPPELREDKGEIELAQRNSLPNLIEESDIRGDLHVHSRWSDGVYSIQELAGIGGTMGYEYILCSDHSSTLGVAHGISMADIKKQQHEIEIANRTGSCKILSGIEVDILSDGHLGVLNTVLADLDLVVAAIHSGFRQEKDILTRRIISAIQNEHVDIIAHPTGRLLGRRQAYELDMGRIIEAARETDTALEINASPFRLDLDDTDVKDARDSGVKLAISTDAHRIEDFSTMKYGIGIARRGWCRKEDVLNTYSLPQLLEWAI